MNPTRLFAPDAGGAPAGASSAAAPGASAVPAAGAAFSPAPAPLAFAETLPADIRGEAVFRDFKDLGSLAKSYLHAAKLVGRDPATTFALPTGDDDKAWPEIYDKLGRPAKPDGYQFDAKLPDGIAEDPALKTAFLARAHESGLSNRQAAALYQWYNQEAGARTQAATQAAAQAEAQATAALKTEWGAAFDSKLDQARRALAHYGGTELTALLDRTKLGNDPVLVKTFAVLGAQLMEDKVIGAGAGPAMHSPTEAKQQINALRGDAQFAASYGDKRHPGHADAVRRMELLHQMAYPQPVS